jgi:hypothetical protein
VIVKDRDECLCGTLNLARRGLDVEGRRQRTAWMQRERANNSGPGCIASRHELLRVIRPYRAGVLPLDVRYAPSYSPLRGGLPVVSGVAFRPPLRVSTSQGLQEDEGFHPHPRPPGPGPLSLRAIHPSLREKGVTLVT